MPILVAILQDSDVREIMTGLVMTARPWAIALGIVATFAILRNKN
jgi:hypothetical protein